MTVTHHEHTCTLMFCYIVTLGTIRCSLVKHDTGGLQMTVLSNEKTRSDAAEEG